MKIQAYKAESFVSTIGSSNCFSALVYGPDSGGVSNLAGKIAAKIVADPKDAFSTTYLDNEKLSEDPAIIMDELSSLSFFGGRKLVWYKNAEADKEMASAIATAVESLSKEAKQGSFLLITAGDLTPASPLRKLYESANSEIAAIPCYVEDEKDLSVKVTRLLGAKKIRIGEKGVVEFLSSSCQGDSKIIESEIEKLDLYLENVRDVILDDVKATTGNTTETQIQDICNLICEGRKGEAEIALRKAMEAGTAPIAIIRTLQRYIEKLHFCANQVNEGKPVDAVVSAVKPPLFFKQVPVFRKHLNYILKKSDNEIWNAYSELYNAETSLKETGSEPELITSRALSNIL